MLVAGVLLGSMVAALPAGPVALGKVAVMDVQTDDVSKRMVPVLSEVLAAELSDSGRFSSVIAARDVKAMLSFEEQRQVLGCSDEACLAEIGGALGADRIVVCQVARIGAQFILTLKLIDINAARTDARVYENVAGEEGALLEALPKAVVDLLGGPAQATPSVGADTETAGSIDLVPAVPIALFAIGVAGLGLGVGYGIDARSKADTARAATEPGSQLAIAQGRTSQNVANVGFGVAATAIVAGALWWWLGADDTEQASVGVGVSPSGVAATVGGRF